MRTVLPTTASIQLDHAAITLRRYHFPSGTSKVICVDKVRGYKAESLGLLVPGSAFGAARICGAGCRWTCIGRSSQR